MNPGELKHRVHVLELQMTKDENGVERYAWKEIGGKWSKKEDGVGNTIYSKIGLSAKAVKFTVRKDASLSLHNALTSGGHHCAVTSIDDASEWGYQQITAALVTPSECEVVRKVLDGYDDLNRPIHNDVVIKSFPAILTEKYLGNERGNPQSVSTITYVMVTPKQITLEEADVVRIEKKPYVVQVCHVLDEAKNEYEIKREADI